MTDGGPATQSLLPLRADRAGGMGGAGRQLGEQEGAAARARWRVARYVEEPAELEDVNRHWRHPAAGKPERVRYAVERDGERVVWGLRTRDAAVRWITRLTAPVQLEVNFDGDETSAERLVWDLHSRAA